MHVLRLTKYDTAELVPGAMLLVNGKFATGPSIQLFKLVQFKESASDGREVILKKAGNVYFNLDMYLAGNSWVKEVLIVK